MLDEAIHNQHRKMDCFVTAFLAMTDCADQGFAPNGRGGASFSSTMLTRRLAGR